MFEFEFSTEALKDLKSLRKFEQQVVVEGIETKLRYEPEVKARNRKKLRLTDIAAWELRIGRLRVFYNVETEIRIVRIRAIGIKIGSTLFIRGEKREI